MPRRTLPSPLFSARRFSPCRFLRSRISVSSAIVLSTSFPLSYSFGLLHDDSSSATSIKAQPSCMLPGSTESSSTCPTRTRSRLALAGRCWFAAGFARRASGRPPPLLARSQPSAALATTSQHLLAALLYPTSLLVSACFSNGTVRVASLALRALAADAQAGGHRRPTSASQALTSRPCLRCPVFALSGIPVSSEPSRVWMPLARQVRDLLARSLWLLSLVRCLCSPRRLFHRAL